MEHKGAQGACDDGRVSRDVINAAKWAAFMMQGSNGDGSVARELGGVVLWTRDQYYELWNEVWGVYFDRQLKMF